MADKTQNIKTRLSFDGEAEYKAACKEINSTLKVLNSEMKLVTAEYSDLLIRLILTESILRGRLTARKQELFFTETENSTVQMYVEH